MTLIDALELFPLRTRRLPCLSYKALVAQAVGSAERPTVDLPVAPAPVPPVAALRGNGSPVIQPGYRLGQHPANFGKRYPPSVIPPEDVRRLLAATPGRAGRAAATLARLPTVCDNVGIRQSAPATRQRPGAWQQECGPDAGRA